MDTNAPKRRESAISQQALAAMNHPFMHESAEALRERIESEGHATFEERVEPDLDAGLLPIPDRRRNQ